MSDWSKGSGAVWTNYKASFISGDASFQCCSMHMSLFPSPFWHLQHLWLRSDSGQDRSRKRRLDLDVKHLFTVGSNSPERGREREKENVCLFHLDLKGIGVRGKGRWLWCSGGGVMQMQMQPNIDLRTVDVVIELYHPPNLCT